jgi:2-polyprenyl-3-methyl-5-hydroxy-6-metoxy-1,4-benzoquinol methylase
MPTTTAVNTCPICASSALIPDGLQESGSIKGYALKRCPGCELRLFDPQPDDATLADIYKQEYYNAWGLHRDESITRDLKLATFNRLLRPVRARFPGSPRLLDCGAATGYLMEKAQEMGMNPYGVELSEFGAEQISRRFGPDRVFCGPFDQAAFDGIDHNFFDIVTMIDFIEHVRDPMGTLAKAFDLLKPQGQLVILTPDGGSLSRRVMGARWLHYKVEHLFYFGSRSLTKALQHVGFTDVRAGRAWKMMNLHYLANQLRTYPHPVLTPIIRSMHALSPPRLRALKFRISFGELLVYATKPGVTATRQP